MVHKFEIEFEDYFIPIEIEQSTEEREDVSHRYWGCSICDSKNGDGNVVSLQRRNFCPICEKEVGIHLVGDKEEVGSKDMWGFNRVPLSEVDLQRVYKWDNIKSGRIVKPKGRDVERGKAKEVKKTLKELYIDLIRNRQALECKIIFKGRINDGWIMPYPFFNKQKNLTLLVANGNLETLVPTEKYDEIGLEQAIEIKS